MTQRSFAMGIIVSTNQHMFAPRMPASSNQRLNIRARAASISQWLSFGRNILIIGNCILVCVISHSIAFRDVWGWLPPAFNADGIRGSTTDIGKSYHRG